MRLFIGIEFPESVLAKLSEMQFLLRNKVRRGSFTAKHNMHVTLQFLGEVPQGKISGIANSLEHVAQKCSPFSLALGQVGYFGHGNPLRVVWVGLHGHVQCLQSLHTDITQAMFGQGFPKEERPYQPHITLARDVECDDLATFRNHIQTEMISGSGCSFEVDHFALICSSVEQGKRVYRSLYTWELSRDRGKEQKCESNSQPSGEV